jgi:hypothetical protein
MPPQRTITVRPGVGAAVVAILAGCLAAAGVAGQWMEFRLGVGRSFGFIRSFDLDQEGNLATWFSVALLFVNAMLLAVIAGVRRGERGRRAWTGLALLVLAMSAEEAASLHEMTVLPLRHLLHAGGLLYYTWVVPGALFVLCVAAVYLPFLARLPSRTRNLFILSGFVYVSGALGFEMISGRYASLHGDNNLTYKLLAHVEESLEMAGLVVLMYALLDYTGRHVGPVTFRVAGATAVRAADALELSNDHSGLAGANDELRRSAPVMPATPARPASQPLSPR